MMKKIAVHVCLLTLTFLLSATAGAQADSTSTARKKLTHNSNPVVFSVIAGSQGLGADIKAGIVKKLSLRAGAAFLPQVNANNVFTFTDVPSDNTLKASFTNAHLLVDFTPFKGNGFRLVGGAAYLIKASGTVTVTPNGSYKYGDIEINQQDMGTTTMDIKWSGVAPYLGISLFRGTPSKVFNITLDAGSYYIGSPKTNITGTGLLEGTSDQNAQLQKNMQGYKWLPVLQVNLNFKL